MAPSLTGAEVLRPVRITPLGEVVLAHGRDLLTKAEALADAVDRFRAGSGRIDIGNFQGVPNLILPAVVRRLLDEHPGCDIRQSEVEPEDPQIGDLDLLFYDGRIEGDVEHVERLDEPYDLVGRCQLFTPPAKGIVCQWSTAGLRYSISSGSCGTSVRVATTRSMPRALTKPRTSSLSGLVPLRRAPRL